MFESFNRPIRYRHAGFNIQIEFIIDSDLQDLQLWKISVFLILSLNYIAQ